MTHANDGQPPPALDRIKAVLQRLQANASATNLPSDGYVPNACLSAQELSAWEAARGVRLPEGYRRFLLEIGNGGRLTCRLPRAYSDFIIRPLDEAAAPTLAAPFPIGTARLREQMTRLKTEGWANLPVPFPELEPFWEEGMPPGCLLVCQYPGGDGVFLVVTGELRGTVWCTVCGGVPELSEDREPINFLEWFEKVF